MTDLFLTRDYRTYLNAWIASHPKNGRGLISALAKDACCQPAYFSRVLLGKAQLSTSQAYAIQKRLEHTPEQVSYFLLLVEWDRAPDRELKAYFAKKIEIAQQDHANLQTRFKDARSLTPEHQATYYSSAHYAALHACISVPSLQTVDALESFLRIPRGRILEVLAFLRSAGLAIEQSGRWKVGHTRLHLGRDSSLIRQHHTNWRIEALKALDRDRGAQNENDLHYSAVVTLSQADATRLKEHWIRALEEFNTAIAPSKDETVRALVLDFFTLG